MSVKYSNLEKLMLRSQGLDLSIKWTGNRSSTLHVLLTLINHESIPPMTLFLLLWFCAILFRFRCICNNAYLVFGFSQEALISVIQSLTYPLNRSKSAKLPLQIFLRSIVAQSRYEKRFEGISPHIWIITGFCRSQPMIQVDRKGERIALAVVYLV